MTNNYELPSQEEIKNSKPDYAPLKPGNYIVKLMKIDFQLKPIWNTKTFNWDNTRKKWVYTLIALPYGMENGDTMFDINTNEVLSLTKWLFKEVNPFAIGFLKTDNATPTNMRALLCYLTKQDVSGRVIPEDFILLKGEEEVTDKELRTKFLAEQEKLVNERPMVKEGYQVVPDIRMYEGEYVACTIETDATKGKNKISRFSPLSSKFVASEDKEKLDKFYEAYDKMMENKGYQQNTAPVANEEPAVNEEVTKEEIKIEDVPF